MTTIHYKTLVDSNIKNFFNVRDEYKTKSIEELKDICKQEANLFDICLLNITGDLNIGTIIRSASLFGARKVTLFGRRKFDNRSTVGAQNYIAVDAVSGLLKDGVTFDISKFKKLVEDNNWYPIFIEHDGQSLNVTNWDFLQNVITNTYEKIPCFIFGNEGMGIPKDILELDTPKKIISIPQRGVLRSFNVAAAMNIIIWDYISHI